MSLSSSSSFFYDSYFSPCFIVVIHRQNHYPCNLCSSLSCQLLSQHTWWNMAMLFSDIYLSARSLALTFYSSILLKSFHEINVISGNILWRESLSTVVLILFFLRDSHQLDLFLSRYCVRCFYSPSSLPITPNIAISSEYFRIGVSLDINIFWLMLLEIKQPYVLTVVSYLSK